MATSTALGVALVAALAFSGCYSTGSSIGTLTVRWTVAGTFDPNACAAHGAATIHVNVFDRSGGFVGEYAQSCTAFATEIYLFPGQYSAQALLADSAGAARSTTINIVPFTIRFDSDLVIDVDFPQASFL